MLVMVDNNVEMMLMLLMVNNHTFYKSMLEELLNELLNDVDRYMLPLYLNDLVVLSVSVLFDEKKNIHWIFTRKSKWNLIRYSNLISFNQQERFMLINSILLSSSAKTNQLYSMKK